MQTKLPAPSIHRLQFKVYSFEIDPEQKNPRKYDFGFAGPGYPDLYWQLYCGESKIFRAPAHKNILHYKWPRSTPPFNCTAADTLRLQVMDAEKGANKPDLVGEWKVRAGKLLSKPGRQTLRFGNLKNLDLEVKVP